LANPRCALPGEKKREDGLPSSPLISSNLGQLTAHSFDFVFQGTDFIR
jgi:hypothetical protein